MLTVPSPSLEITAVLSSGLSPIASGMLPAPVLDTAVPGDEEVSITLTLFDPEFVANVSPSDPSATTPYGRVPTVTLPVNVGGLGERLSTLTLFDPGLATYAVLPDTDRYAGNDPSATLPVTAGGVWLRSITYVLPLRASLAYSV